MTHYNLLREQSRLYWQRVAERRAAEEHDRAQWISGLKLRYGIVCVGDLTYLDGRAAGYWPAGVPLGQYTAASSHCVEIPAGWPTECRCVLLDGEQVSLGGPCPVHGAAT